MTKNVQHQIFIQIYQDFRKYHINLNETTRFKKRFNRHYHIH